MAAPRTKPRKGDTTAILGKKFTYDGKYWVGEAPPSSFLPSEKSTGHPILEGLLAGPAGIADAAASLANKASLIPFDIPPSEMPSAANERLSNAGMDNRTPQYDLGQGIFGAGLGLATLASGGALTPLTGLSTVAGALAGPQAGGALQRNGESPAVQFLGETATDLGVSAGVRAPIRAMNAARGIVSARSVAGRAAALRQELRLGTGVAEESSRKAVDALRAVHSAEYAQATAAYERIPYVPSGPFVRPVDATSMAKRLFNTEADNIRPQVVDRVMNWANNPNGVQFKDIYKVTKEINSLSGEEYKIAKKLLPGLNRAMDDLSAISPRVSKAVDAWRDAQGSWKNYRAKFPEESVVYKALLKDIVETPDKQLARVFNAQDPIREAKIIGSVLTGSTDGEEAMRLAYAKYVFGESTQEAGTAITRFRQTRGVAQTLFGSDQAAVLEDFVNAAKKRGLAKGSIGQGSLMGGILAQALGIPWFWGAAGGSGLEVTARMLGPSRARKVALAAIYDDRVRKMMLRRVTFAEARSFISELTDVAARAGVNSLEGDQQQ
jgi:hypothetical protein